MWILVISCHLFSLLFLALCIFIPLPWHSPIFLNLSLLRFSSTYFYSSLIRSASSFFILFCSGFLHIFFILCSVPPPPWRVFIIAFVCKGRDQSFMAPPTQGDYSYFSASPSSIIFLSEPSFIKKKKDPSFYSLYVPVKASNRSHLQHQKYQLTNNIRNAEVKLINVSASQNLSLLFHATANTRTFSSPE